MTISKKGIELIKKFESLRLTAYKALPTEKYYTIGYGHYGADVTKDMKITELQAEQLLKVDIQKAVNAVDNLRRRLPFNQNQFDALVSFTYNCGVGNLKQLTQAGRSIQTIGEKLVLYNKSNGKVINGLVRRRKLEQELYFS